MRGTEDEIIEPAEGSLQRIHGTACARRTALACKNIRSGKKAVEKQGMANFDGGNVRPGDWNCDSCGAHNFASRNACFKCHAPKGGGSGGYVPLLSPR